MPRQRRARQLEQSSMRSRKPSEHLKPIRVHCDDDDDDGECELTFSPKYTKRPSLLPSLQHVHTRAAAPSHNNAQG